MSPLLLIETFAHSVDLVWVPFPDLGYFDRPLSLDAN